MSGAATPIPPIPFVPPVRRLVGAEAILAAHGPALPQPDQQCGPFAAWAALHAVLPDPPSVIALARASGTRIWPHDTPAWRPEGAPLDRSGWDVLPRAATAELSGTDAAALAAGLARAVSGVSVVPARGPGATADLLRRLIALDRPVGVVVNLRTGHVAPTGMDWDVGHFAVAWGIVGDRVALADSYAELGASGLPAGSRLVEAGSLDVATAERGLLLLAAPHDVPAAEEAAVAAGFSLGLWAT
ncbi:MAG: hypothetical protein CMJ44_01080 [Pimelobacter sp.]|nr:hypothetical protein [Pimelobacter sp.]